MMDQDSFLFTSSSPASVDDTADDTTDNQDDADHDTRYYSRVDSTKKQISTVLKSKVYLHKIY